MPIKTILLLVILLNCISCNKTKEHSCENCDQTTVKLLSRVVYLDPFVSGLYNVQAFHYDSDKRCTKIEVGIIDSNATTPVFNVNTSYTFHYKGANKNPLYTERRALNALPGTAKPFYFIFDTQGKKLKDSARTTISPSRYSEKVINIDRSPNTIITTPQYVNVSLDNSNFDTLSIRNGNLEVIRTRIFKETGNHQYQLAEYGFDKGVNPFNKLNISQSFLFCNSSIGFGFSGPGLTRYVGFSQNNCIGYSINGVLETSIVYSYDKDNYPLLALATYKGNSYRQVVRFEYYP